MLSSPIHEMLVEKAILQPHPPPIKGQACNMSGESYVTARWRNPITVFIQTITVHTKILQLYLSIILQYAWGEQRSELWRGMAWGRACTPTILDTTSDGATSSASVASDLHPAPPSRCGRRCSEWLKTPLTRSLLDSLSLQYVFCYLFIYQQKQLQLREPLTCACHVQSLLWQ